MKAFMLGAGIVVVLLTLVGCAGPNPPNVPSFLNSDAVTRIEITNDQTGQKGLASSDADNLNELLTMLHIGSIKADSRMSTPEPSASAYTLVARDSSQVLWVLRVLDSPTSNRIYLHDSVHPANT